MHKASCLKDTPHGFFTRKGGVSKGLFSSLNFAITKGDKDEAIKKNREIVLNKLGCKDKILLTMNQIHGKGIIVVQEPWEFNSGQTPNADAIITQNKDLVIGILTADCVPILLYDEKTKTVAAIHSGWKGTKEGVVQHTLAKLDAMGVTISNLRAALGPSIAQANYEVGPDVYEVFKKQAAEYFISSKNAGYYLFDLPGLVHQQLASSGLEMVESLGLDTYSLEEEFFSCRRAFHNQEKTFGCMLSAISLN